MPGNKKQNNSSSYIDHDGDERYKTLFEQVNAAAFLTTFEGQILEANHKSCELLRYRWEELLRLSLKDILPTETNWQQFMEEIAAKGGLHKETETLRKDGEYLPVEISISLFRMQGKPVMFVLIWDITERKNAEKKLRESEKKYRGLFEYTTDGIIVLDARGDILDINTRLCEMLDYKKEELIGKNLLNLDLLTANSLPIVVSQFEELLSEKTAKNYTTKIKDKKGNILDIEISSFFLIKKNNEVDNFVLIIRDITERTKAEKKLTIEHELLNTLINNIPDSVYFKDEQNRFILVNKAKAEHWNTKPEDMIGKTDYDFLPPEEAKKTFEDDNQIIQTGQPIINKIEKITYKDGTKKWVSVTKIPRYNPDGDIIGTMGISRDITEWKLTEEKLQEEHNLLQTLMDNIPDPIYFKNKNNKFIMINKAQAAQWNINPIEAIGKTEYDILPQEKAQKIHEEDKKILERNQTIIEKTEKIIQPDGQEQWYHTIKLPRYDQQGNIIGTISISRKIAQPTQNI